MSQNQKHLIQLLASATTASILTFSLLSYYHSTRAPPSTDHPDVEAAAAIKDEAGADADGEKKKKYEEKKEYYSSITGKFEPREEAEEDTKEFYFLVKHRYWPKSQDFEGHEDYVAVEIVARPLIEVLRTVLREVEEVFEEQPALNSKDLFLNLKKLRTLLEERRIELESLTAAEEGGETAAHSDPEVQKTSLEVETAEVKEARSADGGVVVPASLEVAESKPSETEAEQDKEDDEVSLSLEKKELRTSSEVSLEIEQLSVLLSYIDELYAPVVAKLERFETEGVISFNLLWVVFPQDQVVEMQDETSGEKIAFKIKNAHYGMTRDGMQFTLSGTRISWTGNKYVRTWTTATIPKFKGMRKLFVLPVHPLTDKHREELTKRGKLYTGLTGVSYLNYKGNLVQVLGSGMERRIVKLRAEGRAVVDIKSYRRMNPSRNVDFDEYDEDDDEAEYGESLEPRLGNSVPESELCLLPPCVFGFSLVQREWGEMRVDQFEEVEFNDKAYEHLVLDEDYKDLIRSLVEQNSQLSKKKREDSEAAESKTATTTKIPVTMTDVIAGKGGGTILVFHGRPGVGKTLTGEAISELLHVPLYAVGAGELGVTADVLEKRLRDVLDTANSWGGVLLVDEADVFLEARSRGDVGRNALVSVFLRLLEYHQGILILTTNRIRTIDPAFLSRFSIAITYPDLDVKKRRTIWASFLKRAGVVVEGEQKSLTNGIASGASTPVPPPAATISAKYLDKLASKANFNGRVIKNCVLTAQALSLSKGEPLGEKHVDTVVKVTETFTADFKSEDEEGVYDAAGEGWKDRVNVYG